MRVVERSQRLGLTLEAREAVDVGGDRRRQHLDGHLPLQVRVGGAVHLAHAAGAEHRFDHVVTHARAGLQRVSGDDASQRRR